MHFERDHHDLVLFMLGVDSTPFGVDSPTFTAITTLEAAAARVDEKQHQAPISFVIGCVL